MCIIIVNETGKPLEPAVIDNSLRINPHGFGMVNLTTGEVERTMNYGRARSLLESVTDPYVAHCRYATVGHKTLKNVHPFEADEGALLFQNGTIKDFSSEMNDCRQMAKLLRCVNTEDVKQVHTFLSAFDSRFCYISKSGNVIRTGTWHEHKGVWYSKKNVLPEAGFTSIVGVYGTLKQGHGNHVWFEAGEHSFLGPGVTDDKYRLVVNGLPYLLDNPHKKGHHVKMEFYAVSTLQLREIDVLESHPGFYTRQQINCSLDHDGEVGVVPIKAWVYTIDTKKHPDYDTGTYVDEYHSPYNGKKKRNFLWGHWMHLGF